MQYCYVFTNPDKSMSQVNAIDDNAQYNYLQHLRCVKSFRCNFRVYMEHVIDQLCQMQADSLSIETVSSQISSQLGISEDCSDTLVSIVHESEDIRTL